MSRYLLIFSCLLVLVTHVHAKELQSNTATAESTSMEEIISPVQSLELALRNIQIKIDEKELKKITFRSRDIAITSNETLQQIAEVLKNHPDVLVEIRGHTDSMGKYATNMRLSQIRAQAVKDYLIENHHIPAEQLKPFGYGGAKPVADNRRSEGRRQNRRIEFSVIYTKMAAPEPSAEGENTERNEKDVK
jgi:outer membrane protein OmpA-like peptidoglycan-associated protein